MPTPPPGQATSGCGKIFVSYSRRDLEWVRKLATDLEAAGLPVWVDVHQLKPGVVWDSEIELALHDTDILLAILSEDSASSRNVLDEINFALSRDRLVVPVLYRSCDIPYRLARLQHVDFTGSYDAALQNLIERLRAARAQAGIPPTETTAAPARVGASVAPAVPHVAPPLASTPAASTSPPVGALWHRPAVAAVASAGCVLLLVGAWMLTGRDDGSVPEPTASAGAPLQTPSADSVSLAVREPLGDAPRPPDVAGSVPASAEARSRPGSPSAPTLPPVRPTERTGRAENGPVVRPPAVPPTREADQPGGSVSRPVEAPATAAQPIMASAAATPGPAVARAPEPEPVPLPPPVRTAPPAGDGGARTVEPAPAATPAVRSAPVARDDDALIRKVVALYARAINEKSVSLLAQVRPNMSRSEAEALLRSTPATHTVSFGDVAVDVDGTQASVRVTRQDVIGQNPPLQTVVVLSLGRQGETWVIERIQRAQ